MTTRRVCYFYDPEVGDFFYGHGHPMKPHRIRMTHNLLLNYGLYKKLQIFRPWRATPLQMTKFHSDDYVEFLRTITPDNLTSFNKQLQNFNVGEDCPVFPGLWDFCQIAAGGSVGAAIKLNRGDCDIAINWGGGLHHAKKGEASGFCYVNDIVLGILELLKVHERVLYIDIDIHHGDGVEEAFYTTPRVFTLSFHKFGDFFPGTGDVTDIGAKAGRYYAANFPLRDGIDDLTYESIFKPVVGKIMQVYQPGAVVIQCGADSLCGDRLGCFNLTLHGHGRCVEYVKSFNVPTMMVGGGGYTIRNVARCWCYETGLALGAQLPNDLPYTEYLEYFSPDFNLHIAPSPMLENQNSREYLDEMRSRIMQNLSHVQGTPQLTMRTPAPREAVDEGGADSEDEEDAQNPDSRFNRAEMDRRITRDDELDESDDEDKMVKPHTSSSRNRHRPAASSKSTSTRISPPPTTAVAATGLTSPPPKPTDTVMTEPEPPKQETTTTSSSSSTVTPPPK